MKQHLLSSAIPSLLIVLIGYLISGCKKMDDSAISIIPKPWKVKVSKGKFQLTDSTEILVEANNPEIQQVAQYLAERIGKATSYQLKISKTEQIKAVPGTILLSAVESETDLGDEGYSLDVDSLSVVVRGKPAGLFYGVQTIFQLLPPQIYSVDSVRKNIEWVMPAVSIKDKPRFVWRGMHLDVGRHLFPVQFIKKYIDYLAMHKMNTFHWHLTEDQGWHGSRERYGQIALKAGFHAIKVFYFQAGAGKIMKVYLEGAGIKKHEIEQKELFFSN